MRRVNWDIELGRWAREIEGKDFKWGATDCGMLVWYALNVMYDDPPVEEPTYKSLKEAVRFHQQVGSVESILRDAGAREVHPRTARQGDIIIGMPDSPGALPGAAVVVSRDGLVANEEEGVLRRPLVEFSEGVTVLRVPNE